jgi:hypothetical protein
MKLREQADKNNEKTETTFSQLVAEELSQADPSEPIFPEFDDASY